jgi:proteasome lid subunit RPN8/RPN11
MMILAAALGAAWMSASSADNVHAYPVAALAPDAACHGSVREAAVAGILRAAAASGRVEYGGAVFERGNGCHVHSTPVTSNEANRVAYVIRVVQGLRLAGLYHTHTPGGRAGKFSPEDRAEQKRLGVPSYMGIVSPRGAVLIRALGEPAEISPPILAARQ